MTATSGPGLSLMTETLGLAGMAEIPAVIVAAQRPGPSAGMPTRHEQSDLLHMVYASHGEFPRIVLTPGTVEECFLDTALAFNLAEHYQCPVIVAADQDLVLKQRTVSGLPLEAVRIDRGERLSDAQAASAGRAYRRYALTASGISPRATPGQSGVRFISSGDEHDDAGTIDVDDPSVRRRMVDKRLRKTRTVWERVGGISAEASARRAVRCARRWRASARAATAHGSSKSGACGHFPSTSSGRKSTAPGVLRSLNTTPRGTSRR
jgi:2-oxoglutarate ferredoxin oxidoreductase subunit alpha